MGFTDFTITFVDPAELITEHADLPSGNLLQFAIEAMTIESSWIFPLIAWWIFPISFLLTFTFVNVYQAG